ncbi:hypothetical protein LUZ61_015684 [Rhynchospora tenuis]|uniref:cytokinin dehydrogenase n=1 Tax=Rhynchospora tenuis TaxID=198213 RepID=A0AAD6EIX0_9POAL|nr:hypothetical protein LUZ61_015684 [Rhynchospora tenuis]
MDFPRQSTLIVPLAILVTFSSFVLSLAERQKTQDIFSEITTDPSARSSFATDFGNLSKSTPGAVFYPSSPNDIATLIRYSYKSPKPFTISQRGAGHSTYGQTFVPDGILIDMSSLGRNNADCRITVTNGPIPYVDAGGEQPWITVLNATLKYGLTPRIFTDYLYATVGGSLSNAGISGRAFVHGPQISNVYELDVITGTGKTVTCSREVEPDLFYAALGGLGQFGVITRARIALEPAQKRARWVRLFYTDVELLMRDQEKLISMDDSSAVFDFVEGEIVFSVPQVQVIRGGYDFSDSDIAKITKLVTETNGPVYLIDAVAYYDDLTAPLLDQNIHLLLEELHYISGFEFSVDMPLLNFLNRLYYLQLQQTPLGLCTTAGSVLIFPMNRTKWDDKMSAVTPNEEVFYVVSLLWSAVANDTKTLVDLNNQVFNICENYNLGCKKYLPHFTNQEDWKKQFGNKWTTFVSRKKKYDPKALLSPGQKIFTPLELN